MTVAATALTDQEQRERREWFRVRWERGVAFNRRCRMRIVRWDPDGVEMLLPYAEELSAHEGVFHCGVISALIDTAGAGADIAAHDYTKASRHITDIDVIADGRVCARGQVVVTISGERPGVGDPIEPLMEE